MSVGFDTLSVHAGRRADGDSGAILTPIHQSTTFAQPAVGEDKGFTYSRAGNPTVRALEERLAALERGEDAVCYASGMAAIDAVFRRVRSGEHVVLSHVVYGGTLRLLRDVYAHHGVTFTLVDTARPDAVADAIRPETRLVLVETPANPTLHVSDVTGVASVCRARGVPLAVDNTFLTPHGQQPLTLGADLVIHSTTKLLEGHNTTIGGAVVVRDASDGWLEWLTLARKTAGSNLAPFDAWLTLRGLKTLSVRVAQHARNAARVAEWLAAHPDVTGVYYPGLPAHPGHALARRQQRHAGNVMAFEIAGGGSAARAFVRALRVVTLAESLGAVESLVTHPATMTHGSYSPAEREAIGVTDGLLRLSVGLEDVVDVVGDLQEGFRAARRTGVVTTGAVA